MEDKNRSDQSFQVLRFPGDSFRKCVFSILSIGHVPAHIAFIMDGNRRYAKKHRLLDGDGHKAGYSALLNMIKYCYELGVKFVTIYAFSIDNFRRRPDEVETTMKLIEDKIEQLIKEESMLNRYGVRVYFLGNLTLLSESVRLAAEKAMAATAGNTEVVLSVCLAYTSRDEIVHAVEESCIEKKDGTLSMVKRNGAAYDSILGGENENGKAELGSTINVDDIEKHMYASISPDPDIIVRTSGETRLSNFLLWQSANCLLYSPSAFWPEIRFRHLVWAVLEFQRNFSYLKHKRKNPEVSNSSHPFVWIASLVITMHILGFYSTGSLFLWIRLLFCILVLVKLVKTLYSLR